MDIPAQEQLLNQATIAKELYKKNLELLLSQQRIEELLYGVSEAVVSINKDFKITIFNKAAEDMLGKTSDDVKGRPIEEIIFIQDPKSGPISIRDCCFKDTKVTYRSILLKGVSDYYINLKTALINLPEGPEECLLTFTDITKEKQLEKAKDEFISVASHELRTPMTIIKSYLWMLQAGKGGELTDKQKDYLAKATAGTDRMLTLINDILSISRYEQGRVEFTIKQLNLMDIVRSVVSAFEVKTQEKNIYLTINGPIDSVNVYGDEGKIDEILTNLLGNSLKFTKQGGITITVTQEENSARVTVTDTGAGITTDDLKRLFHKFGRLDNSYQTVAESGGTGLGLYIVKMYIEGMGGRVGVQSEGQNKGSTFWFTLPKIKTNQSTT